MLLTFKLGLLLGLSIIISIGAQNLFVIQQAMRNEYAYTCALTCVICDFILILLGATGPGILILELPSIRIILLSFGIVFLICYGVGALRRGINGEMAAFNIASLTNDSQTVNSLGKMILLGLSFSLLNPQAILDTVVIIGGSANHYIDADKYVFVAGAMVASLLWFFGLALLAKCLSQKLMNKSFWRILELISGGLMIIVAGSFLYQVICQAS